MKVLKIISEWKKKNPRERTPSNKKMVEAIVEMNGESVTKHIQVRK